MIEKRFVFVLILKSLLSGTNGFLLLPKLNLRVVSSLKMNESNDINENVIETPGTSVLQEEERDIMTLPEEDLNPMELAMRKQKLASIRADKLREQEVFMKRSTGRFSCSVCDFTYEEAKGDMGTIGGTIEPGTLFVDLPSNWRCPTCRASKDNFKEQIEEIPGFEVNQGYGFGFNAMTTTQKNLFIWGGLGAFFALFLLGYTMS